MDFWGYPRFIGLDVFDCLIDALVRVDADSLCAGENAPDSRWSGRHFTRPSHFLFLAPEMRNESNGIDR